MSNRTQIICLHEGEKGRSIDPVFINSLLKKLRPSWIRPWGSNVVRTEACGGRKSLIEKMPQELKNCINFGGDTTLMVWADVDDDMNDGDQLKDQFWVQAQAAGITQAEFDQVIFIFAKDRLENWIQFLATGATDESQEGPRVKHGTAVATAAKVLAMRCKGQVKETPLPPSLAWSCMNWNKLVKRMQH